MVRSGKYAGKTVTVVGQPTGVEGSDVVLTATDGMKLSVAPIPGSQLPALAQGQATRSDGSPPFVEIKMMISGDKLQEQDTMLLPKNGEGFDVTNYEQMLTLAGNAAMFQPTPAHVLPVAR